MRCVKLEKSKSLITSDIDEPKKEKDKVIIKVESCGICGSDIHNWETGLPQNLVMGHEFAGTVIDTGDRNDIKIGDKVTALPISPCGKCLPCKTGNVHYCKETWSNAVGLSLSNPGGYAELTSIKSDLVKKLPESVSFDEGAMVEPSAVALHATNLADIKVGSKVLIVGGGIIGLMACEFAKLEGASYIALLETNMSRAKKATSLGKADEYFDATKTETIETLINRSNGGFDVVIECCGNEAAVNEAIMTTKPGGKIILVGVSPNPITIPTVMTVLGEISMVGAIAYTEKEFETCIELIAAKKLNVKKYIDEIVPLEKAQDSFLKITSGKNSEVKIIFHP